MVFKCQADSFLKEFSSTVVSCEKASFSSTLNGKKENIDGYEVICEDTVLFPEGGGQPCDRGFLNDQEVYGVVRRSDKAVHLVKEPISVGEMVQQKVNWDKRMDHMQQHSGQHLLSAVLEQPEFKFPTISWYLGENQSYVELDTPSISKEQIAKAEELCNQYIREGRKVDVHVFGENTPAEELDAFRSTRDLPEDHKGDIRVVTIDGLDRNMCCGTHVTNLSQLQVVKLLFSEKSKRKDKTLLVFIVGKRVIDHLGKALSNEYQLNAYFSAGASKHVECVEKLVIALSQTKKTLQNAQKELAVLEAQLLKNTQEKYILLQKKEASPDFMVHFAREFDRTDVVVILLVGEKGEGNIALNGDEKIVADLGDQLCQILEGKGAGKGNRFQGKVANMGKKKEAVKLIEEYFK